MKRLVAAALALLLISVPSPARATEPFNMAPCVQAALVDATYDAESDSIVLNGLATQCGPAIEHAGFGVAAYLDRNNGYGFIHDYQYRRFATPAEGEVHAFGIRLYRASGADYSACLLSAMQVPAELGGHRVACVRVIQPYPQTDPPSATIEPMSTSDPRVSKFVLPSATGPPDSPNGDPDGICPTCF